MIRVQSETERIRAGWRRWHETNKDIELEHDFKLLPDYVYCLEHKIVHEVDLQWREMAGIDCYCEPLNHIRIFVEQDYE